MTVIEPQLRELHCPLCDYNLRGLTEPRCPECGYSFDWADLTDPARQRHPFLFEHHPEKNVRSFVRTVVGHLLPRRFWRSLRPEMPSNRRRLMIYWCVLVGFALVLFLVPLTLGIVDQALINQSIRRSMRIYFQKNAPLSEVASIVQEHGSVEAYVQTCWPPPNSAKFWQDAWQTTRYRVQYQLTNYRGIG